MHFIDLLADLKEGFATDCLVRKNGTLLLSPGKIPKCRHMLFLPLPDADAETLISSYKGVFPDEYMKFLRYSNGANLYYARLTAGKVSIAYPMLTLFGLPMTPPAGRPLDMEEPYDLRIEDLSRHRQIPRSWLKCGTCIRNYDFKTIYDLFMDTDTKQLFSTKKNDCTIVEQWATLDDGLCCLLSRLSDSALEYPY